MTAGNAATAAFVLLWALAMGSEPAHHAPTFAVWNVGQGLWTTLITDNFCLHFDAGGEKAPWRKITMACREKENLFSFSHWDEDHISFAKRASQALPSSCLWHAPGGTGSARKQLLVAALPPCRSSQISSIEPSSVHEIRALSPRSSTRGRVPKKQAPNDMSRIFVIDHQVLAPGDATRHEETSWREGLRAQAISFLVLGHHGSRTSTSVELLKELPNLKIAIASARRARYGHPHAEVVARLHAAGVTLLSTEEWGSIYWEEGRKKRPVNGRLARTMN